MFAAGAAMAFGMGVGTVAGLSVGPYLFRNVKPKDYGYLSEDADADPKRPGPEPDRLVQADLRALLPLQAPWLQDPQYRRVYMINRLVQTMWPFITEAIFKFALKEDLFHNMLKPLLRKQLFDKMPFIEDIVLGRNSLKHGGDDYEFASVVVDKVFTLGGRSPKLEGIKVIPTLEDELLLELTAVWGADCKFEVGAFLRFGPLRLYVPLELSNVSFRMDLRVTVRPLVEEIPVAGGVTIQLLKVPTVDCTLKIIKGVDLMALPFVPELLNFGLKFVLEPMMPVVPGIGLLYPNSMSFPIMPNFGIKPPPIGAIQVTVVNAKVKAGNDMYVMLEVRKGRTKRTRTVDNKSDPDFNEEFALIVDNYEQELRLTVWEDDLGALDTKLGTAVLPFYNEICYFDVEKGEEAVKLEKADWMSKTVPHRATLKVYKKEKKGIIGGSTRVMGKSFTKAKSGFSRIFTRGKSSSGAAAPGAVAASPEKAGLSMRTSDPSGATLATSKSMSRSMTDSRGQLVNMKSDIGEVQVVVKFIPFYAPKYDDEEAEKQAVAAKGKVDPKRNAFPQPHARAQALGASKGVLTVQLIRCLDLAPEGAKDLAIYVKLKLTSDEKDDSQTSSVILNETSPRWGELFDFVLFPADSSELYIEVCNKASLFGNLLGAVGRKKGEDSDSSMGKLNIPVADVARNGMMKDIWTLGDTDRGAIEMKLMWQPCHVSE